ncbi:MAG: SDR family NAD(P)-dependent oxidoreductase [Desulfosarcinaceae bacterium]
MQLEFSGRQALVTGGTCEIALDLARAMIAEGIRPVLGYRSEQGHRKILDRLRGAPDAFDTLFLDLARVHDADPQAAGLPSRIDYLVDLAQDDLEGLVASADSGSVRRFFDAQVSGRAALVQEVARKMLRQKQGRLLFVSSTAASRPNAGQGFYAAAKCAAEALYRNLGLELACRGVTSVALRPGYIDAGRGRRYLEGKGDRVIEQIPLGRPLTSREVVRTILFLLSDSARGFNATVLTMDGGLSAGK